jgi:threonylcarbamoyladenosine tRNA methylthiotransferase MtaB
MKYSVITFGCRVNQADSLGFEQELRTAGAVSASPQAADLVIVNTCSVTATADQGARQTIRRIARDNPDARIVVTGCYATRRPDEVATLPNVVRVIPNDDKPRMMSFVRSVRLPASAPSGLDGATARPGRSGEREGWQPDPVKADHTNGPIGEGPCGAPIEPGVAGRTAFTLRVQTGCAEPCSYCIIPATRGRPRSVVPGEILREVERIASSGFKEIALTGVHLGSYGRDLDRPTSLVQLLQHLDAWCAKTPDRRSAKALAERVLFRISSLEPMDCSREIVDLVADSDAFAPHFHLPLQHASNRVLSAMRRPYTIEYYSSLVGGIRSRIPHASIGSDVIVGFPGETDDDFERLASFLERSPLTHIHVFPYSDRPGTPASMMSGKVAGTVVRERGRRVREIGQRLTQRFRDSQVGTTHLALTLEGGSLAVTGNYLKVRIPPGHIRNEWITVEVTGAGDPMVGVCRRETSHVC